LDAEEIMPHRRRVQKGSFAGHFDELVSQFPAGESSDGDNSAKRDPKLQEKIDIHALLFAMAWQVEDGR
jgi:hypothetical protein